MTPEQLQTLRTTWQRLRPDAARFGSRFYARLFEFSPESHRLFERTDWPAQEAKFVAMLDEIVRIAEDDHALVRAGADLGRRHVDYGVRDADYPVVTTALLLALGEALGDDWTPEVREAWGGAITLVTSLMRRGAGAGRPG